MLTKSIFVLIATAPLVLAHGNLRLVHVENPSADYTPWLPFQDGYMPTPPERFGRKLLDNGPVEDVTSTDIQCNKGAAPAALVATAAAGSKVALNWTDWPSSHMGPVITYLAKAPSDITKWSPGTDKVWFKIDEAGLKDGKWAASQTLISQKSVWTVTIPPELLAGEYLMRHEIIALHAATAYPGAQFYPSCLQFKITGSGTALPKDSDLVAFPGAYSGTDPGIKFNPYANPATYVIPGPPLWSGAVSGSNSGSNSGSDSGSAYGSPESASAAYPVPATTNATYGSAESGALPGSSVATSTTDSYSEAPTSSEAPTGYDAYAPSTTDGYSTAPTSSEASSSFPAYAPPTTDYASTTEPTKGFITSTIPAYAATTSAPQCHRKPPTVYARAAPAAIPAPGTLFAQCGGAGFKGAKTCMAPYICKDWSPQYSQCIQA